MKKTINLLGEKYRIIIKDTDESGRISYEHKAIILNKSLDKQTMKLVLAHELSHFFIHYYLSSIAKLAGTEVLATAMARFWMNMIKQLKLK